MLSSPPRVYLLSHNIFNCHLCQILCCLMADSQSGRDYALVVAIVIICKDPRFYSSKLLKISLRPISVSSSQSSLFMVHFNAEKPFNFSYCTKINSMLLKPSEPMPRWSEIIICLQVVYHMSVYFAVTKVLLLPLH